MIKRIEEAKSKLMLENPYFGTLVTSLELRENDKLINKRNRGDIFEYNREYIEALTPNELTTLLANAAMHQALFHKERGEGKVTSVWQLASDYAINNLLVENGFMLPPMANYSARFERLYTEQIYTTLLGELDIEEAEEQEEQEQQNEQMQEEILSQEEYELILEQLGVKLEKQGDLPKGIERFVPSSKASQISWREELYRYVNIHAKSDYRMFPPSKKHLYRGIALPSIYGEELKIAVAIDTSASIDDALLQKFLGELEEIMQLFTHYMIELIACDAEIQNIQQLTPHEPLISTVKGGGGTDFRPVFEHLEFSHEDFKFLLYFTDGDGTFPNQIPMIDILWVMPKRKEVPFGEVLVVS